MVYIKNTALCSACKNRYELDCDGYPEATYRLKDAEAKKKWRCKLCIKNKKYADDNVQSNITLRKKQPLTKPVSPIQLAANINENVNDDTLHQSPVQHSTMLFDSHILTECETSDESYSTPKISRSIDKTITDLVSTSEMRCTITQLTLKLESTENKLGDLLSENSDLREQIKKLTVENQRLESVISHTNQKLNCSLTQQNNMSTAQTSPTPDGPFTNNDYEKITLLKQEIDTLQQQLQVAEQEISKLTGRIKELMRHNHYINKNESLKATQNTSLNTMPNATKWLTATNEKKIVIYGSQRCVGLAAAISRSRANTQYER
ncbi:hypothetical protein B5X24_HaOG213391 [Helicoverpa armigera]|nr:hypothetical protein B5X24_HaOG213391 [Helicoverpa armigera]